MKILKTYFYPTFITSVFILVFQISTIAQIQKETWMIGNTTGILKDFSGGNSFLFTEDIKFSVTITPDFGYMKTDKLMFGTQFSFSIENGDGATFLTSGLLPFIRIYFSSHKRFHFFVEEFAGLTAIHATGIELEFALLAGAGTGINYFFTPNIALETTGRATFAQLNGNQSLDFGLRFGIQIFFNRKSND